VLALEGAVLCAVPCGRALAQTPFAGEPKTAPRAPLDVEPPPVACGNGILEEGEVCEGPGHEGTCDWGRTCRLDCQGCDVMCGDHLVGPDEACDPPGSQSICPANRVCDPYCLSCSACGNAILDPGEVCDPPFERGQCGQGQLCRFDCSGCDSICGDGILGPGEMCDPSVPSSCPGDQVCSGACTGCLTCGNGILDAGETCDPAVQTSQCPFGAACRADCSGCETTCGDDLIGPGEICDPPGLQGGCLDEQICRSGCQTCTRCGNGRLDPGESCDPSTAVSACAPGQACAADCSACTTSCDDGAVGPGEVCDLTDHVLGCGPGQVCDHCASCTACGNGIIDPGEACDTPGSQGTCPAATECRLDCTACDSVCGDGLLGPGETCEPPGAQGSCPDGTLCSLDCSACEICTSSPGTISTAAATTIPASFPPLRKSGRGAAVGSVPRVKAAESRRTAACAELPLLKPCEHVFPGRDPYYCGWDITHRLLATINSALLGMSAELSDAGVGKAVACQNVYAQINGWDIKGLLSQVPPFTYKCGKLRTDAADCVQVCGKKQWLWDVNYVLWGLATGMCGLDPAGSAAKTALYKIASLKGGELTDQLNNWFQAGYSIAKGGKVLDSVDQMCEVAKVVEKGKFKKGDYTQIGFCPVQQGAWDFTGPYMWETWMVRSFDKVATDAVKVAEADRKKAMCKKDQRWKDGLIEVIRAFPFCNSDEAPCQDRMNPLLEQLYNVYRDEMAICGGTYPTIPTRLATDLGGTYPVTDTFVSSLCNQKIKEYVEKKPAPEDFGKKCVCRCTEGGILFVDRADVVGQKCENLVDKECPDKFGGAGKAFDCWDL
jgi:hypothetical protein